MLTYEKASEIVEQAREELESVQAELTAAENAFRQRMKGLRERVGEARMAELLAVRQCSLVQANDAVRARQADLERENLQLISRDRLIEKLDIAIRSRLKGASELDADIHAARTFGEAIVWKLENSQAAGGFTSQTLGGVELLVKTPSKRSEVVRLERRYMSVPQEDRAWEVLMQCCPIRGGEGDGGAILCPPYELVAVSSDFTSLRPA